MLVEGGGCEEGMGRMRRGRGRNKNTKKKKKNSEKNNNFSAEYSIIGDKTIFFCKGSRVFSRIFFF